MSDSPTDQKIRFRFLAPLRASDRRSFETNLSTRFSTCGVLTEGAVEYVDRVIDRQINKANGLLAFDGLLFTALSVVSPGTGSTPISIKIGSGLALVAALPLILLLVVSFGKIDDYTTPSADFTKKCQTIYWRTYAICFSVLFSIAAALTSLWRLR